MIKKIAFLAVLLLIFVSFKFSGVEDGLTLASLQGNAISLQDNVANNYSLSVLGFIFIYIIVLAFSIPGATILTLAGGFLFGVGLGTLFVNIGATLGATIAFLSSRYLIGKWVQNKYKDKLKKFNEELKKNGRNYLLTLRFIPIFPLFLINLFAGLTKIPLRTFIWTTSLGIIPGSLVYTFAGKQLRLINSVKDILSVKIFIALVLLGLFSLIPVFYSKFKKKL